MSTSTSKLTNFDWAKDIPCKNITIYGYCKHEDKCAFKHDHNKEKTSTNTTTTTNPTSTSSSASDTNGSTPTHNKIVDVPVFTPSSPLPTSLQAQLHQSLKPSSSSMTPENSTSLPQLKKKFNFDSPSFTPTATKFTSPRVSNVSTFVPEALQQTQQQLQKFNIDTPSFSPSSTALQPPPQQQAQSLSLAQVVLPPQSAQLLPLPAGDASNDVYFQQQLALAAAASLLLLLLAAVSAPQYPLQHHLYTQVPPPHFHLPLAPYERDLGSLFIPNHLRESLQRKNELLNQVLPHSNLPDHVNNYHSLVPIDTQFDSSNSKLFALPTTVFKVESSLDGKLYCLRKITLPDQLQLVEKSITQIQRWFKVNCANIVKVVELFTSMLFQDNSLFLVHDFYPCSLTLIENHYQSMGKKPTVITELLLWSYLLQLTNAIAKAHLENLAIRVWDLSKIIVTSENRVRISGAGVLDILEYDEQVDLVELQRRDFQKFGELMFRLLSTMVSPVQLRTMQEMSTLDAIPLLTASEEFKNVLNYLNSASIESNIEDLQRLLAPQMMKQMDGLQNAVDFHEAQLVKELENGRLFRLLTKLNFICERPEFLKNESWSETGERYPIKLFRDYVFHQVNEAGKPVLDLIHVLTSLNKLDCGIDEKLLLVSSDEKSCLIISYKELKELVESSFRELNK